MLRLAIRRGHRCSKPLVTRCLSGTAPNVGSEAEPKVDDEGEKQTHFGFRTVNESEKVRFLSTRTHK